jgi:gas vesicle protein
MSTKADELKRDIEQARGDLGTTLEQIGDRVAPKKVVARTKADLADKVDDVKEKVSPRRLVGSPVHAVRASVRSVMGSEGESSGNGSRGQFTASARQKAGGMPQRAGETAGNAVDGLRDGASSVKSKAEGNPMAAGLFAFAAGFLAASLLPPSRRERQLVEKARHEMEPLANEAARVGKGIAGELQSTAQRGLERVKDTATQSVEQVRSEAQERARQIQSQAGDAADEVSSVAKSAKEKVEDDAQQSTRAVKGHAKQAAASVKGQAKESAGAVKGKAKQSAQSVKRQAKQSERSPRATSGSTRSTPARGRSTTTRRSSRERVR